MMKVALGCQALDDLLSGGVEEDACGRLLQLFFEKRR